MKCRLHFAESLTSATYRRSVDYTLAKSRFGDIANVFDAVVLIAVLFQRRVAMGVWKIQRELRQFDLGDGWFPLRHQASR